MVGRDERDADSWNRQPWLWHAGFAAVLSGVVAFAVTTDPPADPAMWVAVAALVAIGLVYALIGRRVLGAGAGRPALGYFLLVAVLFAVAVGADASIELRYLPDRIELLVADDGRGFRQAAHGSGSGDGSGSGFETGFGLRGMRQRIEAQGGRLHVDSVPGAGTTLLAELPVRGATEVRPDDGPDAGSASAPAPGVAAGATA